ncbi:MAG: BamA/TamA family outer membrane protein [Acidobacteria bacterium]|nr:BamA/TamA family outer membrane protein [Acidobacteriota bacterium]
MRVVLLLTAAMFSWPAVAHGQQAETSQINVNSRYTIESVEVPSRTESKLSDSLRSDLKKLIGAKFKQEEVDQLTSRMRKELRGWRVVQRITKGEHPENIRVVFDVTRSRSDKDIFLPRLAYHSRQNFSFGADGSFNSDGNRLRLGILTDNDELLERYSGIRGGYERIVADGRFRGGFLVESFRSQWNSAVQSAVDRQPPAASDPVPGIYRTRLHAEPYVGVELAPGVTLSAGYSFQRLEMQFPAARHESSRALTSSLRLNRRWEPADHGKHTLDAGYTLRAAASFLDSDFVYTRHAVDARYRFRFREESITASVIAGSITGRAPLFERFTLGNSTTLRGYNKYDVTPLGGNRMAHGSLDYRHGIFRIAYDVGTVYDRGKPSNVLHSVAFGLTTGHKRDSFSFLVALPLRENRIEPIFMVGMNF